jgi:hypothetical protein
MTLPHEAGADTDTQQHGADNTRQRGDDGKLGAKTAHARDSRPPIASGHHPVWMKRLGVGNALVRSRESRRESEEEQRMGTSTYDVGANGREDPYPVAGVGWLTFAGMMLGLAGIFNVLDGILALADSKSFTANAVFVFSDLRTWGWIVLILGALQLIASVAIFAGSEFARWFGITVAGLNAIAQLGFVQAYPVWSIAIFAMDIMIIYALAVYGGAKLRRV